MEIIVDDVDVPNFHTAIKDNCQVDLHLTMERVVSTMVVINAIIAIPRPILVKSTDFVGRIGFLRK